MGASEHLLTGLIRVVFVRGIVLVLTPTISDADFLNKKSFPQAGAIKKIIEKTVCGFRYPGVCFVTSKDDKEVCDRPTENIREQDPIRQTRELRTSPTPSRSTF